MYGVHTMNDITAVLIFATALLGALLTLSELIAFSTCKANSIGQWLCGKWGSEE
jgi:hypothetical protein